MLQIDGKLVSSYIYIVFIFCAKMYLFKLASIFVIVFQFEPAYGLYHTIYG